MAACELAGLARHSRRSADGSASTPRESDTCMREHPHFASARRDDRLARIRKLTLCITGAAAAVSLGLGTAFAHALPGHATSSQSAVSARGTASSAAPGSAGGPGNGSAGSATGRAGKHHARRHRHQLAAPKQQPASTPAPPVVSSGGS